MRITLPLELNKSKQQSKKDKAKPPELVSAHKSDPVQITAPQTPRKLSGNFEEESP